VALAGRRDISPWCDLTQEGETMRTRHGIDPLCAKEALDLQAAAFLGGAEPRSWDASPVNANLEGLPPILVQIGDAEVMLSGAVLLAERLTEQGVRADLQVWPHMFHVWHLFAAVLPQARAAIESLSRFHDDLFDRGGVRVRGQRPVGLRAD
jgi:monoterpene epsilon-lactone hydrolase